MHVTTETQALKILDDPLQEPLEREAAARFLKTHPTQKVIRRLVQALQDDDFGVRWDAAEALAHLGEPALPELLKALTEPQRIGDSRLREGAYHTLHHMQTEYLPVSVHKLMETLKGPASDIAAFEEAHHLLEQFKPGSGRKNFKTK
jgi:HEAT repeat protein